MDLGVPVVVDDIKTIEAFEMTRCVYFQIEGDEPFAQWFFDGPIPFRMVGLAGIVIQPPDGSVEFTRSQQVEELFDFVERRLVPAGGESETSVELADIWLPNRLLSQKGNAAKRGDVFRLQYELFRQAFAFRYGRIQTDEFQLIADRLHDQITYSEIETRAFSDWAESELAAARNRQNQQLALGRKDND